MSEGSNLGLEHFSISAFVSSSDGLMATAMAGIISDDGYLAFVRSSVPALRARRLG